MTSWRTQLAQRRIVSLPVKARSHERTAPWLFTGVLYTVVQPQMDTTSMISTSSRRILDGGALPSIFGDVTGLGPLQCNGWCDRSGTETEPGKAGERCNGPAKRRVGHTEWCVCKTLSVPATTVTVVFAPCLQELNWAPRTGAGDTSCNVIKPCGLIGRGEGCDQRSSWLTAEHSSRAGAGEHFPCPDPVGPATETGQMDSTAAVVDWRMASWRGCPAPVIGFVACVARCNDGSRNVSMEGLTPGASNGREPEVWWNSSHPPQVHVFGWAKHHKCPLVVDCRGEPKGVTGNPALEWSRAGE